MNKRMMLAILMVLGMSLELSAQLPSVTLKDINGKDRGATSWPGCYQN